ncbi:MULTISPECIES: rhomboid family intramembrane serine protease [Haloarcula]|uniref:rhomboid family intramembrane serine protease n=1 Tax=Haloarcula TaxID=2237 RepID=UPI00166B0C2E|nr:MULTISPECIES: rhomboid family intramembrane serine protease [Halomicroarcula]MBX0350285.1 rhomboid family intramembrane serine protease [Halomicroarcula pellucida]MDS0277612.1 rhomboid family intramembrane serine protease [Halomicroarcula sp. S1AR25-4]
MISRVRAFLYRNHLTPILILGMIGILQVEIYVSRVSESLFKFWFVAQPSLTPGLLIAPLSHSSFLFHLLPNMALFVIWGWLTEDQLKSREYIVYTALTAYLSIYLQVLYSAIITGQAGTLGFSGAVYSFPPAYAFLAFRSQIYENNSLEFGLFMGAIAVSLAIPLSIAGYISSVPGMTSSANVAHSAGFAIGTIYGAWKYWNW